MAVVYEKQTTNISWYSDPLPGEAKDNYDRIKQLRAAFCHPLTINNDNTLNQDYFSNKTKETAMNWQDIELLQLYEGIFKHGVDNVEKWIKIKNDFLPQRDFIEVRLKLTQLFGLQDLSSYKDTKFTNEQQIQDEFNKNKAYGIKNNLWNNSIGITLKDNVANCNSNDWLKRKNHELNIWKKYIYDNPVYIYRTDGVQAVKSSNNKKKKKIIKKKKKKKINDNDDNSNNKIDNMFKKQIQKENINTDNCNSSSTVSVSVSTVDVDNDNDIDIDIDMVDQKDNNNNNNTVSNNNNNNKNKNKSKNKKKKVVSAKKKKNVTFNLRKNKTKKIDKLRNQLLANDESEDEDMLCVE